MLPFLYPGRQDDFTFGQALRIDDLPFAVIGPLKKGADSGFSRIGPINYLVALIKSDAAHNAFSVGLFDLSHNGIRIQRPGPLDGLF